MGCSDLELGFGDGILNLRVNNHQRLQELEGESNWNFGFSNEEQGMMAFFLATRDRGGDVTDFEDDDGSDTTKWSKKTLAQKTASVMVAHTIEQWSLRGRDDVAVGGASCLPRGRGNVRPALRH
jgi:hypothetical protein